MSRLICLLTSLLVVSCLWCHSVVQGQQAKASAGLEQLKDTARENYAADVSYWIATFQLGDTDRSPAGRSAAAKAFLETLSETQRDKATFELQDAERRKWTNLPASPQDGGIKLGVLNQQQTEAACKMMATFVSPRGFNKWREIMLADDQLLRPGRRNPGFGTETFSLAIFGEPSETDPWAFQIDGHHLGFNLAFDGDKVTHSPSFIGTQPHEFKIASHTIRPFQNETQWAHQLAVSLNDDQIRAAVLAPQRGRLLAGPGTDGRVPETKGIRCDQLSEDQQATLMKLIGCWVEDLPEPLAQERMKQVKNEIAEMYFSWNGGRDAGSDMSYRIQSPSLIIEYACQDLGGNPLDHLHSMYRNPKNEYGGQLD